MPRRPLAVLLALALMVAAGCADADDEPTATLAPVAPVPPGAGALPPPEGGAVAPPGGGGGVPPSAAPAPPQLLTQADLAAIEGAAGLSVGTGLSPNRVSGLCGEAIDYEDVWRSIVRNANSETVVGQTVFRVADEATAAGFIAKLQSAEQGCIWEIDPLRFEYVGQETGVEVAGDSMFAYRMALGRVGKESPDDAGLIAYVQQGDIIILVHGPPKVDLDLVNAVLAAVTA